MKRGRLALAAILAATLVCGASQASAQPQRSQLRHVTGCAGGTVPAVSPSGKQVAWLEWASDEICFARIGGGKARRVSLPAADEPPSELVWARRNLLVALGDYTIYSIAFGRAPRVLPSSEGFSGPAGESFSLDAVASLLVTGSSTCDTCAGPIVVARPRGAGKRAIGDPSLTNYAPSLSPDGKRVVFAERRADDSGTELGLWVASTAGAGLHRLDPAGDCPLWSPAGGKVAYLLAGTRLVVAAVAGGRPVRLAADADPRTCAAPGTTTAWAPNGKHFAFVNRDGRLSSWTSGRSTSRTRPGLDE